ncbi:MAG: hypothetical protein ABL930_03250 [Pseudobdellovibrio sp.]
MKLFLITLLFSTICLAQISDDPSQFCNENQCTENMQRISDNYTVGNANFAQEKLSAYSGTCYHLNPLYNPEDKHYGVMTFENNGAEFLNNGYWGFFFNENPYDGISAEDVKKDVDSKHSPGYGEIFDDHTELGYISESSNINYWFKSSPDLNQLYAIGRWLGSKVDYSNEQFMFCELMRH